LKHRPVHAFAEIEVNEKAVETRMYEYLQHVPQAAGPMGIHIKNKLPNAEDVARTARDRLFVKIKAEGL
jgi:hypothetical protein